jgi:hypothetical protein
MSAAELLKMTKESYDRLNEISPIIPSNIIEEFQHKFSKETTISKPEIANGLEAIEIYKEEVEHKIFTMIDGAADTSDSK